MCPEKANITVITPGFSSPILGSPKVNEFAPIKILYVCMYELIPGKKKKKRLSRQFM